jgi:hypothetical protein
MDTQKLKIKVGDHEFEAEGPAEVVQAQFAAWRDMVSVQPITAPRPAAAPFVAAPPATDAAAGNGSDVRLEKITRQDGRVVSLTARGASVEDEVMLVLFGQKMLRDNDSVTGSEVIEGLRLTGRTVNRVDYQLDKLTTAGDVITIGVGRARRYRLTNQGSARARELAQGLIAKVA